MAAVMIQDILSPRGITKRRRLPPLAAGKPIRKRSLAVEIRFLLVQHYFSRITNESLLIPWHCSIAFEQGEVDYMVEQIRAATTGVILCRPPLGSNAQLTPDIVRLLTFLC